MRCHGFRTSFILSYNYFSLPTLFLRYKPCYAHCFQVIVVIPAFVNPIDKKVWVNSDKNRITQLDSIAFDVPCVNLGLDKSQKIP